MDNSISYSPIRVANFEKVSRERFVEDWINTFHFLSSPERIEEANKIYDEIRLPERATKGSAGYDFFSPDNFGLYSGDTVKIPTGIRVRMREDYVMMCFPRSGLGFKHRFQLDNTVGIIDSDYYYSDNEGHIFIKATVDAYEDTHIDIKKGMGFAQGIFLPFGITMTDNVTEVRNGGFGSTTK